MGYRPNAYFAAATPEQIIINKLKDALRKATVDLEEEKAQNKTEKEQLEQEKQALNTRIRDLEAVLREKDLKIDKQEAAQSELERKNSKLERKVAGLINNYGKQIKNYGKQIKNLQQLETDKLKEKDLLSEMRSKYIISLVFISGATLKKKEIQELNLITTEDLLKRIDELERFARSQDDTKPFDRMLDHFNRKLTDRDLQILANHFFCL